MTDAPAPPRPAAPRLSGRAVLGAMLAIGVLLVLGVGTFAALTRTPVKTTPSELALPR